MKIITIVGFCILAVIICKTIEKDSREIKLVAVLAVLGLVLYQSVDFISAIVDTIESLFLQAGIDDLYIEIVFKALGICYIVQLGADYCKDCGENALASQIQLAGRLAMLSISLPLFSAIIEIVKALL